MILPDLITKLAEKESLSIKDANSIVKLILRMFTDAMKNGDRIEIRGFGSFVVRDYRGYKGRNPKTREVVEVKPKRLPFFRVGKELKDRIKDR
jgi:integration host factor subunit beta